MIIINHKANYGSLGFGRAFVPITPEVEAIMANYSGATDKMAAALALFFANIGDTIKAKIKCAFFPLFSSNESECLYSFVQNTQVYPHSGGVSGLYFDNALKLLQCNATSTYWQRYIFYLTSLFGSDATKEGNHSVIQIMPSTNAGLSRSAMGIQYTVNGWALSTINWGGDYSKLIGLACRDVLPDGSDGTAQIFADRGVARQSTSFASFNDQYTPFGMNSLHSEGKGSRIVIFAEGTTIEEDYIIRAAVVNLDNAFFS